MPYLAMVPFGRSIARKALAVVSCGEELNNCGRLWSFIFSSLTTRSTKLSTGANGVHSDLTKTPHLRDCKVAVFWDLDNKPPKNVSPFKAATRLKEMAAEFGEVVDVVAYANHHAFSHVPSWIHEERRQRKVLNVMEASGELKPQQPYVCGVCGSKKKTHADLTKHFKMLHEREQRKRMHRLESLKGKKKQKERFLDNNADKIFKYKDAAQGVIIPKVGYGLMQEIKRAGVYVKTVKDEPQAADIALKNHMMKSIKKGVKCICLVSDDTDFKPELKLARERKLHTVVVGDLRILSAYSDTYFSWAEVASGRAEQKAKILGGQLFGEFGSSVECGLDFEDGSSNRAFGFDLEQILEEVPESDFDTESDEDEGWDLGHRFGDVEEDKGFNCFRDDTSESDSESDKEAHIHTSSKLHGCLTDPKFGINVLPPGLRGFATKCDVSTNGQSEESISRVKKGAPPAESYMGKPERLHHFFTMLESANKGINLTVQHKTLSVEDGDSEHIKRVQAILRSAPEEKRGNLTSDIDTRTVEQESTQQKKTPQEAVRSSVSEERETQFGKEQETVSSAAEEEGDEDFSRRKSRTRFGRRSVRKSLSSSVGDEEYGKQRNRKIFSSSRSDKEEEESSEGSNRTRFGRFVGGKPRSKRVTKIIWDTPSPYYLSGFASESQKDCDAVNRYYAEWWKDDTPVYKGKQNRKRKKTK